MNARQIEEQMLNRCVNAACIAQGVAQDGREANIFRLAGMVLQSRFPRHAGNLTQTSEQYFAQHPQEKLPAAAVVQHGWVASLSRLRDMLSMELQKMNKNG